MTVKHIFLQIFISVLQKNDDLLLWCCKIVSTPHISICCTINVFNCHDSNVTMQNRLNFFMQNFLFFFFILAMDFGVKWKADVLFVKFTCVNLTDMYVFLLVLMLICLMNHSLHVSHWKQTLCYEIPVWNHFMFNTEFNASNKDFPTTSSNVIYNWNKVKCKCTNLRVVSCVSVIIIIFESLGFWLVWLCSSCGCNYAAIWIYEM